MAKIKLYRSSNETWMDHQFHGTDSEWRLYCKGTGGFQSKEIEVTDTEKMLFDMIANQDKLINKLMKDLQKHLPKSPFGL